MVLRATEQGDLINLTMTLKEFKDHLSNFPDNHIFDFGISEPFSWRGFYSEVAFEIVEQRTSKEEIMANINKAYNGTFIGWKGGEYVYDDHTEVHFEEDNSMYSGGEYCAEMIAKIEKREMYSSQEMRLAKIAFPLPPAQSGM
jgi:hypothetical protein